MCNSHCAYIFILKKERNYMEFNLYTQYIIKYIWYRTINFKQFLKFLIF